VKASIRTSVKLFAYRSPCDHLGNIQISVPANSPSNLRVSGIDPSVLKRFHDGKGPSRTNHYPILGCKPRRRPVRGGLFAEPVDVSGGVGPCYPRSLFLSDAACVIVKPSRKPPHAHFSLITAMDLDGGPVASWRFDGVAACDRAGHSCLRRSENSIVCSPNASHAWFPQDSFRSSGQMRDLVV